MWIAYDRMTSLARSGCTDAGRHVVIETTIAAESLRQGIHQRSVGIGALASEHPPHVLKNLGNGVAEGAGVGLGWKLFTD